MTDTRKRRGRGNKASTPPPEAIKKAPMSVGEGLAASAAAKEQEREAKNAAKRERYGQPPPKEIAESLGLPEGWKPTVDDEGNVYLDKEDLLEHQAIVNKAKYMREIVARIKAQRELEAIKHQMRMQGHENMMVAANGAADEVENSVIPSLHSRWTKKYGLDFRKVALDTETGKLLLEDGAKVER